MISHPKVVAVLLSTALVFLAFGDGHDLRPDRAAEPTGTCDSAGPERICHAAPAATENDQLVLMQKRISAESFVELATSTTEDKCKAEGAPCTYDWNGEKNLGDDECCSKRCDKHWNEKKMTSEFACVAQEPPKKEAPAAPTQECTGDPEAFDAGYGNCETYARDNADFCSQDQDVKTKASATEVCPQCGQCIGAENEALVKKPKAAGKKYKKGGKGGGKYKKQGKKQYKKEKKEFKKAEGELEEEVETSCETSAYENADMSKGEPGTCKGCLVPTSSGKGLPLCHYRESHAKEACEASEGKVWCGGD